MALEFSSRKLISLAALLTICAFSLIVHADEDDDFMEVSHRTSQDTSHKRAYAGSRDEQGIEIQAALPQPTRSQDGSAVLADDGADLPTQAPASD